MKINNIEHIGIAVNSLSESIQIFEKLLGIKCYGTEEIADQCVKTAFFKIGNTKIELLESTCPDGPINSFLEKKGPGIHHMAFAVDNVDSSLNEAHNIGFKLIDRTSRKGAENLRIGFLNPKSTNGILIELCSK